MSRTKHLSMKMLLFQNKLIDSVINNQSLSLQVCDNASDDDDSGGDDDDDSANESRDDVYNESSDNTSSDYDDDLLPGIEQLNISCDKYLLSHITMPGKQHN